jgi:hypothetical protein
MADKRITSRTKVYITRIGLKDWLVAVDSQKAALKAWDVHRNLFATGEARLTNDPAHVELAMRTPGEPVAAAGRLALPEAASNVVKLPVAKRAPAATKPAPEAQRPKPKPDRAKLDAAEEELRIFEREAARQQSELARRKLSLETEIEAFEAETSRRRERLEKRVVRERTAYEDAT